MTLFRPCIDLHEGKVKQIVGGTLQDGIAPVTNFVSSRNAAYYASLYRNSGLVGGHIILLGPGNEIEAKAALKVFPKGLQVGGGIHPDNASEYLNAGASHVIATSWFFENNQFSLPKLQVLSEVTTPGNLVIDLSCRRQNGDWYVATNRWQTITETKLSAELFQTLQPFCAEYLIHAADVEGLRQGLDWDLVKFLAKIVKKPTTYAGGASSIKDLERMEYESQGQLDLTIGSALDIFGGVEIRFSDCVAFNQR